ncbi:hypothetical protein [Fuerstiella marisgermanici]|uniref:Lipoprotein n=1 Tax=Fuerstiella marisgermanici TaxID=1891926 RepID=A0A1P8WLD3_9PLAN|nr:hypothetical protein [Fuerstiella marisgermanici]APZ94868.1 hypothetical protein Fuma_04518 [Fuerstiella marisgermanici]
MKLLPRVALHRSVVALSLLAATGCNSEPDQLPEVTVNVPDQFERDGIAWQKQPGVQAPDMQCLKKFFSLNQDLAGSPEFEGQPTVFTSGTNDRRFYWLNPAADGLRWQCVEFRNRKFSVMDGTENPF